MSSIPLHNHPLFDPPIDRFASDSEKWNHYDPDVLPLWVADMDFRVAEPILQAMHQRVDHGIFGYGGKTRALREAICTRLDRRFHWQVRPEEIVFIPGVITGINLACHALSGPGTSVLIQPPVYPPFLEAAQNAGAVMQQALLSQDEQGRYFIDFDAFEAAMDETTRVFVLCSPHNPIGRVWTRDELEKITEICARRNVTIVSDEIHADLIYSESRHIPLASVSHDAARQTITLMSPSKTFNLPGLYCSFAVIQDPALRKKFQSARQGLVGEGNLIGIAAADAAFRFCDDWLEQLLVYLQANRDYLVERIQRDFPGICMTAPQGTYLAWLDCRSVIPEGNPGDFFLKNARVGLVEGSAFGPGGEGFVRLNFGCTRATLAEALDRMQAALEKRKS